MDDDARCAKCGHALQWHGNGCCENGECECNGFLDDDAGLTLDLGEGKLKEGERG